MFPQIFLAVISILFSAIVSAKTAVDSQPAIDEVLVIGEQSGPKLWRVYKDDHVLWVMGTLSPMPKKMKWRSKQVETVIANSQELLMPVGFDLHIGLITELSLLPSLIGVANNPDGKKLEDILPADIYARWSVLKERYIGHDTAVEKYRPIFAGNKLFEKSIDESGLGKDEEVWSAVNKIAKRNKLVITAPMLKQDMKDPKAALKEFKKASMDDVECFTKIIERLETDLDAMRVRANAWAVGDIDTLRKSTYVDNESACIAAFLNTSLAQGQGIQDTPQRLKTLWLNAAEEALVKNESTFAMLPITEVLKPDGYVASLQAKGYVIEGQGFGDE